MSIDSIGALLLVLLLGGCGSPLQRNYSPTEVHISSPPVGEVATARVGDEMLRQGRRLEIDAINVPRPITASKLGVSHSFGPGIYVKFADGGNGEYFVPEQGPEGGVMTNSSVTTPVQSLFVAKSGREVCGVNLHRDMFCTNDFEFRRMKRNAFSQESFQQTLIYSGRVGHQIKIAYREFLNDLARPAYSNDVVYDLEQSRTIAYKGSELEVLDATNQSITYKVISNFNEAGQ